MFYCFVYPESIDQILLEYFDKDAEESAMEIAKYKTSNVFYICRSCVSSMYLVDSEESSGKSLCRRIGTCGDIQSIIAEALVRKLEVRLCRFGTKLAGGVLLQECCDLKMDFTVGKIFSSSGKRMGNFLAYRDNRTKRALADILKRYQMTEVEPTGDMCRDMVSLLVRLDHRSS